MEAWQAGQQPPRSSQPSPAGRSQAGSLPGCKCFTTGCFAEIPRVTSCRYVGLHGLQPGCLHYSDLLLHSVNLLHFIPWSTHFLQTSQALTKSIRVQQLRALLEAFDQHHFLGSGQSDQVQQHGLSQRSTQAADSSSPSVGPVAAAAPVSSPVHQAANTGQSEQQPQAGSPSRSASSSTFHAEPVAERMQPHSQSRSAPSGVPTHPVIPAGHPEAQRQAAASEMGSPCHSTSQQPGESALHQQSPTTGLPRTSGQGSNHGAVPSAAAASQDNTMQRQGHSPTAVLPSTSQLQGSMTRPQARRAWPVVNRRRGQESNGVLVDNYSAVVSDSDTSEEEEEAQQPVHLLGNLNAKTIQSGE